MDGSVEFGSVLRTPLIIASQLRQSVIILNIKQRKADVDIINRRLGIFKVLNRPSRQITFMVWLSEEL